MSEALHMECLTKVYRGKKGLTVPALLGLTLSLSRGEVFGFLGPNGAGKSTTIKLLMGLIKPTSGVATIFETPVSDASARLRVGFLPENPSFPDNLTGREYMRFVGKIFGMDESLLEVEITRLLGQLQLLDSADRYIRGYSKGMVQRLGLAQAMLHDPDLYILDEPMSGLDPIGRALVKDIIKSLKQSNKTVFFSTHITSDVEIVCDRVGVIAGGRLMALDSVQSILSSGVEGFQVQMRREASTAIEEVYVEQNNLQNFLAGAISSGTAIESVEPIRKDMEAFFLQIVSKSHED